MVFRSKIIYSILFLLVVNYCSCNEKPKVTLESLLKEMVDVTQFSNSSNLNYITFQESSYDRKSTSPENDKWYANNDGFGIVNTDTVDGRIEKVLFESNKPGAITRIWITTINPKGTLRFYFDGNKQPGWIINSYDLTKFGISALGKGLLQPHTSYEEGIKGGSTFYLPIPYAKSCKVTLEEPIGWNAPPRYYHINYREYNEPVQLETFSVDVVKKNWDLIVETDKQLLSGIKTEGEIINETAKLLPKDSLILELPKGNRAVSELEIQVTVDSANYEKVTRQLILCGIFDGKKTITAPVSDFFGCGIGAPYNTSWFLSNNGKGLFTCKWFMPYNATAKFVIHNFSDISIPVKLSVKTRKHKWTDHSLYFHASWKQERNIPVTNVQAECSEWNFTTIIGRGIYCGDMLSLFNYSPRWYGEGDEKIWIDNETFPSHFGTGTEDYYNSSWAPVVPFYTPFGGAPRADLFSSHGYNTFFRTRNLDAIPFNNEFKFNIEMISWVPGKVNYATTVYWYGDKNAHTTYDFDVNEVLVKLPEAPENPRDFKVEDCIEFEEIDYSAKSDAIQTDKQNMLGFSDGKWSGGKQVTVFGGKVGDYIEYDLPTKAEGFYTLFLYTTKSLDYGIISISINDKLSTDLDLYCPFVTNSEVVQINDVPIINHKVKLKIALSGKNDKSPGYMFGLDCVKLIKQD